MQQLPAQAFRGHCFDTPRAEHTRQVLFADCAIVETDLNRLGQWSDIFAGILIDHANRAVLYDQGVAAATVNRVEHPGVDFEDPPAHALLHIAALGGRVADDDPGRTDLSSTPLPVSLLRQSDCSVMSHGTRSALPGHAEATC